MSEPHPRSLVYPNVRPEWCSPSWHAAPVSTAAFLPAGQSKLRVRPLLRAILRKLRAKVAAAWPGAQILLEPTRSDHVRVAVRKGTFPADRDLAVRAYLRNLSLDDRMLDRRVAFQRSEPDGPDSISAVYDVCRKPTC